MNLVRIRSMRMVAIGSCLAVGFSAFGGGTARALTTPPTGTISCGVAAGSTASAKPGIPGSGIEPTAKWTMVKVHMVPFASCNNAGVTGGKAPITGGVMTVNARVNPGVSCDALLSSLSSVNKAVVIVKLTNTVDRVEIDPITQLPVVVGSQTRTVAVIRAKDVQASQSGGGIHLTGTAQQSSSGNKPFGGETVEVQLNVGANCAAAPVTSIDLTGSTVSIH